MSICFCFLLDYGKRIYLSQFFFDTPDNGGWGDDGDDWDDFTVDEVSTPSKLEVSKLKRDKKSNKKD